MDSYIKLADDACENGDLDAVLYLINENVFPSQNGIDLATENGFISILQHLAQYNLYPSVHGANMAAYAGNADMLNFLALYNPPILPDNNGIELVEQNGNDDLLALLMSNSRLR